MERNIVRTICFGTLLLTLAVVPSAADHRACSNAALAGTWGYTWTGTIILPTGAVPAAAVGTFSVNAAGDLSGTQTSSVGLTLGQEETLIGTATPNPDCTGRIAVYIYDQSGAILLRTAEWAVVYVDSGTEARGIFRELALPNDTKLPIVGTADAKKLFPNRGNWPKER